MSVDTHLFLCLLTTPPFYQWLYVKDVYIVKAYTISSGVHICASSTLDLKIELCVYSRKVLGEFLWLAPFVLLVRI